MLKKFHTLFFGGLISIIFWILESFIHLEIDKTDGMGYLPKDLNELWMRTVIIILIMSMSIYVHISHGREVKIEREKSRLKEQLLDEQYNKMELILDTRKQTQDALHNFNNSVSDIKRQIENDAVLTGEELSRLLSIISAMENKLSRLWS